MISQPAGFWRRLLAIILDVFIVWPLALIGYLFVGKMGEDVWFSIVNSIYSFLPVVWMGYTVGKKTMGIRIAKVNGEKVGFGTMLMRNIVAGIVYTITLGIGLIVSAFMIGFREDKRAIHDFIAGTYVTHEQP
jgi:uncharacterized RDD family membrane protein YckC